VGDGSRTRFWHDAQCGDHSQKVTFPELFCLAKNKDALVTDLMVAHNDVVHWDINFIKLVHDWEVDSVSHLFNVLYSISIKMSRECDNKLCWIPSKSRSFKVKSFS